ncbi:MAG: hypothetical protein EOP61_05090 [Sphingomonadales bacterium]|nr:MAG: hypothetical protein EOP61_05090 [Sphingomonadales bacterium]
MTGSAPVQAPAAAEAQLQSFIARFTPEIAERVRACRTALRACLPTANELVYDNYQALAIGYAPGKRSSEAILSIAVYPRVVRLFFLQGAGLPDPGHVLTGQGRKVRSIILESPATLDAPAVAALLAAALERAPQPLPLSGAGRTIIKSISAKQRPRRPAKESA